MWFSNTVACALTALLAGQAAAQVEGLARCGNEPATVEQMAVAANLSRIEGSESLQARSDIPDPIVIPVYFHVLAAGASPAQGYLTDEALAGQLRVLNEDFAPHNISFDLKGTTRTINALWAADGDRLGMRGQLRQGGYDTLNLYFLSSMRSLGYCTLPSAAGAVIGSQNFIFDGCAVLSTSVPGGSLFPYDLGRTATHEVGHWMHLLHTFDGGCSCVGDLVHDTPAEARDHYGCPVGLDSCPGRPGLDPIDNFMAYTDE